MADLSRARILLPKVFGLLLKVECRLNDDTYLQCFSTQLAKLFHQVTTVRLRLQLAVECGLINFLEQALGSSSDQQEQLRDFAFLLMQNLCLEVAEVAEVFCPERDLRRDATSPALNFLNRACKIREDWHHGVSWIEIIWRRWFQGNDHNWSQPDLFFKQSFQALCLRLVQKSEPTQFHDKMELLFDRAAPLPPDAPCPVASEIICNLLRHNDISPDTLRPFEDRLGRLLLKPRTLLAVKLNLRVTLHLKDFEVESLSPEEFRNWIQCVEAAAQNIDHDTLVKWLTVNTESRHVVAHLRALARFKRHPEIVDSQVMSFLGAIRQDYTDGFRLDHLNAALTTLSEVKTDLTESQFEVLSEIGSMRTMATESRVLALHTINKRMPASISPAAAIGKLGNVPAANSGWRLKDLTLQIMIAALKSHRSRQMKDDDKTSQVWLSGLVRLCLEDSCSFVRASAVDLMANLTTVQDLHGLKDIGISEELIIKAREDSDDKRRLHKMYLLHKTIRTRLMAQYDFHDKKFLSEQRFALGLACQGSPVKRPKLGQASEPEGSKLDQGSEAKGPKLDLQSGDKQSLLDQESDAMTTKLVQEVRDQRAKRSELNQGSDVITKLVEESEDKRSKLDQGIGTYNKLNLAQCEWESCLVNPANKLPDSGSVLCPTAYLISSAFSHDLEEKLAEFDEFCEIQQGLLTVIEDILQSQSDSNQIDLIDCF